MKYLLILFVLTLAISCRENSISVENDNLHTGSIILESVPAGASIYLDSKNTNKVTPDSLINISTGKHLIKFSLKNYKDTTVTVVLTEGTRPFVKVLLNL